jgi:hypothetical protein
VALRLFNPVLNSFLRGWDMLCMQDLNAEYAKLQKQFDQSLPGKQRLLLLEEMQRVLEQMRLMSIAKQWH